MPLNASTSFEQVKTRSPFLALYSSASENKMDIRTSGEKAAEAFAPKYSGGHENDFFSLHFLLAHIPFRFFLA